MIASPRRSDADVLGVVFEQTFDNVFGMLRALLGDDRVAEQVAQRTYLRARDHLRGEQSQRRGLNSWLARTAVHEAARRAPDLQPLAGIGAPPYDARRVRTALWRRPSEQREVLALRLLAGLDSAQVAAVGGRSLPLVRSLQERGLRSLTGGQRTAGRGSDEVLDQALDRVVAGERPDVITGSLPAAGVQAQLLEVATAIRSLLPISPDPDAFERVRAALQAAGPADRPTGLRSRPSLPVRPSAPHRPALRPLRIFGRFAGLVILALVGALVGIILAGAAVTSEPDSSAYPLRRVAEDALVMAHRNPTSRASLEVDLSDQRLREAEAMALQGKAGLAVQAVRDRFIELRQAARALIDAQGGHDSAWQAARSKLGADEVVSLQQIETQLTVDGDGWAAAQVRAESDSFQNDRRFLDQELGPVPTTSKTTPSEPSTIAQPTALP